MCAIASPAQPPEEGPPKIFRLAALAGPAGCKLAAGRAGSKPPGHLIVLPPASTKLHG